jgi:hypothetical protein
MLFWQGDTTHITYKAKPQSTEPKKSLIIEGSENMDDKVSDSTKSLDPQNGLEAHNS